MCVDCGVRGVARFPRIFLLASKISVHGAWTKNLKGRNDYVSMIRELRITAGAIQPIKSA